MKLGRKKICFSAVYAACLDNFYFRHCHLGLDILWTIWVSVITVVHDDILVSIKEEVKVLHIDLRPVQAVKIGKAPV